MSRRTKRWILVAFFLVAGCFLFLFTFPPLRNLDISNSASPHSKIALKKSSLQKYNKEGELIWELTAEEIKTDQASNRTVANSVEVSFKSAQMNNLVITARKLTLFNKTSDMELEGDVEAVGDDFKLITQKLEWDAKREVLETETPVNIDYRGFKLTGNYFRYSPSKDRITIEGEANLSSVDNHEGKP